MAKPISYGLVLEGEDAKDFEEYMSHPTFTKKGLNAMRALKSRRESEGKTF